jgi:hypothetical protein
MPPVAVFASLEPLRIALVAVSELRQLRLASRAELRLASRAGRGQLSAWITRTMIAIAATTATK